MDLVLMLFKEKLAEMDKEELTAAETKDIVLGIIEDLLLAIYEKGNEDFLSYKTNRAYIAKQIFYLIHGWVKGNVNNQIDR